jgi:hypothetical protein
VSTRVAPTQGPSHPTAPAGRRLRSRGASIGAIAAVGIAAVALIAIWQPWGDGAEARWLTVTDHRVGEVVYEREMRVGETFALEHTHSVTRRPVTETFSILEADEIGLEELVFDDYGPNLPAGPEHVGPHATFETNGREVRIRHHGHPIGTLPLVVGGEHVDHAVVFEDGQRLRLLDVTRRGSRVELAVAATTSGGSQR